jgi:hypothetical protein
MALFNTFKGGDIAPTSGVYSTLHSTPHTLGGRTTYVEGDQFKECWMCPLGVWYRLEEQGIPTTARIGLTRTEMATG